ncbi:hypothetical protein FGF1_12980 [Flavobacteriaceae bacterium GF1]
MENPFLIGIDLESLESIIQQAVAKELQILKLNEHQKEPEEVISSRQEAADFLGISLTLLWEMDKSGELPAKRIKSKVVYLKGDLIDFLSQ